MDKGKEPRKLLTPWIFLLILPLLYVHVLWMSNSQSEQLLQYFTGSTKVMELNTAVQENQESLDFLLSRLMKGEELKKLKETGFVCSLHRHSQHCVSNRPLQIDTKTMTLTIPSNRSVQQTIIRPYARQEDEILLRNVTPVKVVATTSSAPPLCQHNHRVPAVIFSTSGFTGNVFHEFNEIIIPLFITTSLFKSRVQFIIVDYKPSFVAKYAKILTQLTSHGFINPNLKWNQSVHCFPGAVIGLKFHHHLTVNSSDVPVGLSMKNFKQLLRKSFHLKYSHVSQIQRPTVLLLSRTQTRRIINEDDVVSMMEEIGFRVVVIRRAKVTSNVDVFSGMINECSVLVGVHGAGLTNELFLPDGAVMVQMDIIGLEWAAHTYYGDPAREMGVTYLRYKIEAEESSLFKVFGSKNHAAFLDPRGAFSLQAGREIYLNGQNVMVNVPRFRETMVEAMSIVRDSPL